MSKRRISISLFLCFESWLLTIKELWNNPGVPDGSRNTVTGGGGKNRIMPSGRRWMELETVLLSKKSQTQKDKEHIPSLLCRI